MTRLVFDVETDGLLRDLTTIHCLVTHDLDSGLTERYDNEKNNHYSITEGLGYLMCAEEVWGHNIVQFDFEAIKSIYPFFHVEGKVYDTLIMSRLFFTDLTDRDFRCNPANMPSQLFGRHSLEAWGHRLGIHKSEFGKSLQGDWSKYTPEMLDYCAQDVKVSTELSKVFQPKLAQYEDCINTETHIAEIMAWQEREGFPFDITKAHKLEGLLRQELEQLSDEMRSTFLFVDGGEFTPKRPNKTKGYVEGCTFSRLKEFNPTSRNHIAWAFEQFRGWKPNELTNTGRAKIDEKILQEIGTPESNKFARILELQKHLGQLSEGANAWLKKVEKDGRIHHSCILNTNTGRMAHMRPNLGQVPSASEYRELFNPGPDRVQVGADASGLELRCLAHYLARYDGGAFAKEVVEGDIHTHLSKIYETDRKTGKSCTYCLIYGGGNTKLGLTAGASKATAAKRGRGIRSRILDGLNGFKELSTAVAYKAGGGTLDGLDGRPIRLQGKQHAALNYLIQSAGAVICKLWLLRTNELLQEAEIDYYPLAFIHDEMQLSVAPADVDKATLLIQGAMKDVRTALAFRCELDSEYQTGRTWAECH